MAENARPPVAIRIVRPFDSEDALLENELETIGKTSVILIGAHPRPTGVILRFEVTLQTGAAVLRGEGRVLAHKDNAFRGQAGLTLRFTRLDPKSKAVVDRATAMREAAQARAAVAAPSPIAQALSVETPEPAPVAPGTSPKPPSTADQEAAVQSALTAAREKANAQARLNAKRTSRTPPPLPSGAPRVSLTPPPAPVFDEPAAEPAPLPSMAPPPESLPIMIAPDSERAVEEAVTAIPGEVAEIAAPRAPVTPATTSSPADRAALLARLRSRSAELSPERVQAILESAPQRRAR